MEPKTRVAKIINKTDKAPTVRHGTVERVDGDTVQVLIDNTASPITCARACVCVQGDRVVVVGKDAIATVGANYGGGGSGNIATTSYVLKGDNAGNAIAATPGTDYMAPVTLAPVATSGDYDDLTDKPTIPAAGLPTGGSSGQVLAKSSGTDYDVGWVNQSGGGGGSIASTNGLLAGDGTGNAIAADPASMFVLEQYVVINGASVANNGVSENTLTITKSGYYPIAVAGWTSSNRYPNVYGCRLTEQNVGSGKVFVGVSNFSGSTRTLTVSAVVLWVKVS